MGWDVYGGVELALAEARAHRYGEALQYLRRPGPRHVRPQYAIGGAVHHQLNQRF